MNNLCVNDNKKRNVILDAYKGMLIILVVLRHVLQYSVDDEGGIITNIIWAIQMPGFMLVSGYFSARRIECLKDAGKRILSSVRCYALPFFSWFILVDVFLLGRFDRNPLTGLKHLLYHVDSGLWFLWSIFVLSICMTFVNFAFSSRKQRIIKTALVIVLSFIIIGGTGYFCGISFLGIKYVLYYSVFYGFGWFVKQSQQWWINWWHCIENGVFFLCIAVFLAIIFNYDLYNTSDSLVSILLRCIAGFSGNAIVISVCKKNERLLAKMKLNWLGMYTLEIYATHIYFTHLLNMNGGFFTLFGFATFLTSLLLTIVFTLLVIVSIKAIPWADYVMYGKKAKKLLLKTQ